MVKYPLLRLLLPLMAGIVCAHCLGWVSTFFLFVCIVPAAILLLVHAVLSHRQLVYRIGWMYNLSLAGIMTGVGGILYCLQTARITPDFLDVPGVYRLLIKEPPRETKRSVTCKVEVICRTDRSVSLKRGCLAVVYLPQDSAAQVLREGDVIAVQGQFEAPRNSGNPADFDYAGYLLTHQIRAIMNVRTDHWMPVGHDGSRSVLSAFRQVRRRLLDVYRRQGFDEDEFAILAAMTLGYRDELSSDLKQSYQHSGAMHVLAVSGLHVGILCQLLLCLLFFLNRFPYGQKMQYVLSLLLLWAYALLVGMPPSVMRASVMLSLIMLARIIGRESHLFNNIAGAAFFLLVASPLTFFDVGFQLSFAAVTSIVFFHPRMVQWLPVRRKWLAYFRDLVLVSVAAQIGTAPLLIYYFHQFSMYFALTSAVVIPAAYIVLTGGFVLLIFSQWSFVAAGLSGMLHLILRAMNGFVRHVEHLPGAVWEVWTDEVQTCCLMAGVVLLGWAMTKGGWRRYLPSVLCLTAVFGLRLYHEAQVRHTRSVVAYNDRQADVVQFCDGMQQWILTNDTLRAKELTHASTLRDGLLSPVCHQVDTADFTLFHFHDKSYLLLSGTQLSRKFLSQPVRTDYLIIGNVGRTRPKDIRTSVQADHVVLLRSLQAWKRDSIAAWCEREGVECHDVRNGTYLSTQKVDRDFKNPAVCPRAD